MEIKFSKISEYPGDPILKAAYIIRKDIAGTESERIELGALFDDNHSKMILRRLSNNQIVIEFSGIDLLGAKIEMKKLYGKSLNLDLVEKDQVALQSLFARLKEEIIFDKNSRKLD